MSSMNETKKLFWIVILFNIHYSMHYLKELYLFCSNTTQATYGIFLFVITPHFNISWTNLSIYFLWWWLYPYRLTLPKIDTGLTSTICSILLSGGNSMGIYWNTFLCFWINYWTFSIIESSCYESCIFIWWNLTK